MGTRFQNSAELNAKNAKILDALLKLPENRFCVDCDAKGPRWASVNLGVFMCIRCSGIHRSMGTHISKVKSVTLDTWAPDQVEFMVNMGNEKGNEHWEANLPSGYKKPAEHDDSRIAESFIRSKYERKEWAARDGQKSKPKRVESEPIIETPPPKPVEAPKPKPIVTPKPAAPPKTAVSAPAPAPVMAKPASDDLLLEFSAPVAAPAAPGFTEFMGSGTSSTAPAAAAPAIVNVMDAKKQNILNLFNAPTPQPMAPTPMYGPGSARMGAFPPTSPATPHMGMAPGMPMAPAPGYGGMQHMGYGAPMGAPMGAPRPGMGAPAPGYGMGYPGGAPGGFIPAPMPVGPMAGAPGGFIPGAAPMRPGMPMQPMAPMPGYPQPMAPGYGGMPMQMQPMAKR